MEDSSVTESILYKVRELAAQQYELHIGDVAKYIEEKTNHGP